MPIIPSYSSKADLTAIGSRRPAQVGNFDNSDVGAGYRALGQMGQAIGNVGELAARHAEAIKKVDNEDIEIALDQRRQAVEEKQLNYFAEIKTLNGQERLNKIDEWRAWDATLDTENNPLDFNRVTDSGGYYEKRIKQIGINVEQKAKFNIKFKGERAKLQTSILPLEAEAREVLAIQTAQGDVNNARNAMLQGLAGFEDVNEITLKSYISKTNIGIDKKRVLIQNEIQINTEMYLEGKFKQGDVETIQAFKAGQYNDEILVNEHGDNIIERLSKKADDALIDKAVDLFAIEHYKNDENKALEALNKNTTLGLSDEQKRKAGHSINYNASLIRKDEALTKNDEWQKSADNLGTLLIDGKLTPSDIRKSDLPVTAGKGIDTQYSQIYWNDKLTASQDKINRALEREGKKTTKAEQDATFNSLLSAMLLDIKEFDPNDIKTAIIEGLDPKRGEQLTQKYNKLRKLNNPFYTQQMQWTKNEVIKLDLPDSEETQILMIMDEWLERNPNQNPREFYEQITQPYKEKKAKGFFEKLFTSGESVFDDIEKEVDVVNPYQKAQTLTGQTELPDATQHKDRTVRDTESGKRYKSDGTQWIEVK